MNLKQAKQRIEELERKVREMEAQPSRVVEHHYHYYPQPLIGQGPWWTGQPTCTAAGGTAGLATSSTFVISGNNPPMMSDGLQWSDGGGGI